MGTLWYISPKQLRNTSQVTDRADVFSLGALLYRLISGRPPIRAGSEYELIAHYITDQKISPLVEVRHRLRLPSLTWLCGCCRRMQASGPR